MRTRTAVLLTVFIMSLLNVIIFDHMNMPQGCFTMACILTPVIMIYDILVVREEKKEGK